MIAVRYQTHVQFQYNIWPRSQTSRISGWRRQNSLSCQDLGPFDPSSITTHQTISDVYRTKAATTTVMIIPGTNPSTEYE